jgi:DNA-binding XRE family transcriptional regulator
MGRPTTFTEEIGAQIVELIGRVACSRKAAAETVGVEESTVRSWEKEYPDFSRAMKKARGTRCAKAAERLNNAAEKGDTAAIIFTAKCLDPDQWNERKNSEGVSATSLADALRELARANRERDGLVPPDGS